MASDRELFHVIKGLKNTITELHKNYPEQGLPVTDGSRELQQFCAQLEFLLQYDLKEKRNLFGQRKDYWDFLSLVLTKLHSGTHEGVQHISSLDKLKTAVGKGRAFIRYCLVHQQLAETLQLCFMEPKITSDWYYARSPFLDWTLWQDILGCLYELDGITFHLALCRADLDAAWPMVSEALPRCSIPALTNTQVKKAFSEVGNSNTGCTSCQGATQGHGSSLKTKDQGVIEASADDPSRPGLEQSVEKWIGVWRSRKNSLLQMGSFLKLHPFMEKGAQHPASGREVQSANGEVQVSTEQPGSISSHCLLPQPEHCLSGQLERPHQVAAKGDDLKQKNLRTLMWEVGALQLKLSQQQEEGMSLRHALSEEHRALKEELVKCEEQCKEKTAEQEKQQQELARVVKALKEAEHKVDSLTSECQMALARKHDAEKALEEAEQRLSSQEVERRKHLDDIEAQERRHQQLLCRCQGLQEKLKVCEESLERWERQVVALNSQQGQMETAEGQSDGTSCRPAEREEYPIILERGLLKEKLERSLAEIKVLEKEKETLMETLVSQEQSLVFTKLEVQNLQKELSLCQENIVSLRISSEEQEKTLRDREEAAEGLQRNQKELSEQLQGAMEKNTTLEAQLHQKARELSQLEAQVAEGQIRFERTLQELRNQLGTFEKKVVMLQEERQELQAALQKALQERDILTKQVESTTVALEGQTQVAMKLRDELENLKATNQAVQKAREERSEMVASALREECLQLRNQVEQLEQEKTQATDLAEKLSEELEQFWGCPTEEGAALLTVPALAYEVRDKRATAQVKENGNIAEKGGHGAAKSWQMGKELFQADVLQDLGRPAKKGTNAKHGTDALGKCLTSHLDKMTGDVQQAKQMLLAKETRTKNLMEQLSRSQQEKEQLQRSLEKSHQESEEKEKKYKKELLEQRELICSMKEKLLELLR
ncbi:RUN and FYVE domain-containing protein 4 [Varanus komodoensis]|uniref:RUN and FYVE domain-containing protein 4 n=1 Tax=Varanus komodoensis TaxID=61221 RepID=UPI001CF7E487|nr:RUN and FYVE domain-containing protein 4 [Varanus komodoensis]